MLQHNVPPAGAKRTPLACQTCRRRKTKCDSNYPCSVCADSGELCVREPSSTQTFIPMNRAVLEGSLGEENRSIEVAEDVDYEGPGTPTMRNTDDTSPMRLDWNIPMDRSAGNHVFDTRPTLINTGTGQDSLLPITDPLMRMMSGINTVTSTPNRTPATYFSEPSDIMSFPFDAPVRQPSFLRDHFVIDEPCEIHMSHVPTFTPSRSFASQWELQTTIFENELHLTVQTQMLQCLGLPSMRHSPRHHLVSRWSCTRPLRAKHSSSLHRSNPLILNISTKPGPFYTFLLFHPKSRQIC